MGVAANGQCLPTLADAAAYACGAAYPVSSVGVDSTGGVVTALTVCSGTTGSTLNLLRYKNGGSPANVAVTFAGPACDELQWLTYSPFGLSATDGGLLAAAVASVWLVAWGWKAVYRTVWGTDEA